MPDFSYRQITFNVLWMFPDSESDGDAYPDVLPIGGTVTFTPFHSGPYIAYPSRGFTLKPSPIVATLISGEIFTAVTNGEGLKFQPLFLPVTDDADADQVWGFHMHFEAYIGDEQLISDHRIIIPPGEGILNLVDLFETPVTPRDRHITTYDAAVRAEAAAKRAETVAGGITDITASGGAITITYGGGKTASIPLGCAVSSWVNNSLPSVPSHTDATVTGWVPDQAGAPVTINAQGTRFTINQAGTWQVTIMCSFTDAVLSAPVSYFETHLVVGSSRKASGITRNSIETTTLSMTRQLASGDVVAPTFRHTTNQTQHLRDKGYTRIEFVKLI